MPTFDLPRLFNTLTTLLKTRPTTGNAALINRVQPVIDVVEIVQDAKVRLDALDLTPATGTTAAFTVPGGKRWRVLFVIREGTSANSRILVNQAGTNYDFSLTGTAAERLDAFRLVLNPGDQMRMANSGNVGDSARGLTTYYEERDYVP